jgi:hypothetical protein
MAERRGLPKKKKKKAKTVVGSLPRGILTKRNDLLSVPYDLLASAFLDNIPDTPLYLSPPAQAILSLQAEAPSALSELLSGAFALQIGNQVSTPSFLYLACENLFSWG